MATAQALHWHHHPLPCPTSLPPSCTALCPGSLPGGRGGGETQALWAPRLSQLSHGQLESKTHGQLSAARTGTAKPPCCTKWCVDTLSLFFRLIPTTPHSSLPVPPFLFSISSQSLYPQRGLEGHEPLPVCEQSTDGKTWKQRDRTTSDKNGSFLLSTRKKQRTPPPVNGHSLCSSTTQVLLHRICV